MGIRQIIQRDADGWESLGQFALWQRFLLRNGKAYTMRLLPAHERGTPGYCFFNAGTMLKDFKGGAYVEGMAMTGGLVPLHHAWVGVGDQAYEVTWSPRLVSGKPRTAEYLGVPLTKAQRRKGIGKTGTASAFSDSMSWNTDLIFEIDPELEREMDKWLASSKSSAPQTAQSSESRVGI